MKPLEGLLVLDMSQFLAGPSAALRLADLGARVVKIERPVTGDLCRQLYISNLELDGDSTPLMTLSSLASEAWRGTRNLVHIVWDNRSYAITGGQPTATAFRTDLAAMARGAGYPKVERVETLAAFQSAADRALSEPGPWFIHCLMKDKPVKGGGLPSPTAIKHRFMDAIGAHH